MPAADPALVPTSVLDASALLAMLHREQGGSIEAVDARDCVSIVQLRPTTKPQGLSLADGGAAVRVIR